MTFLETCLAIAVISITMATALPSLVRAKEDFSLTAAARNIASHLHSARIRAITRRHDCRLSVTSATSYVIECDDSGWVVVDGVELPNGIRVSGNARPEFHRRGNVSPAATIAVSDTRGKLIRVIVNVNGRVRLQ